MIADNLFTIKIPLPLLSTVLKQEPDKARMINQHKETSRQAKVKAHLSCPIKCKELLPMIPMVSMSA